MTDDLTPALRSEQSLDHYTELFSDPERLLALDDIDFNALTKRVGERISGAIQQVRYIGGSLTWAARRRWPKEADFSRWLTRAGEAFGVTPKTLGEWRKAVQESQGLPDPSLARYNNPRSQAQTEKISVNPAALPGSPDAAPSLAHASDKADESGEPEATQTPVSGTPASQDVDGGEPGASISEAPSVDPLPDEGAQPSAVAAAPSSAPSSDGHTGGETRRSVEGNGRGGASRLAEGPDQVPVSNPVTDRPKLVLPPFPMRKDIRAIYLYLTSLGEAIHQGVYEDSPDLVKLLYQHIGSVIDAGTIAHRAAQFVNGGGSLVRKEVQTFDKDNVRRARKANT